jgi:adenylate cyclase class 2
MIKKRADIPQELEVKFYLSDKAAFEERLRRIGAVLQRPRTLETNHRFDTADMSLSRQHRVLRLRQDIDSIVTYKGPSILRDGVSSREEIEFKVSGFEAARQFLEALGYKESIRYEKWRTIYMLDEVEITLDEMPFGNFTEIEASEPRQIHLTATKLALDWKTRITSSYMVLFDQLRKTKKVNLANLTFEEFRNLPVTSQELGVKPADKPLFI